MLPLVVTLLSLPLADAVSAQAGPRLVVGSRIRVSTTASPARWVEGSLAALTADRLQLDQQSFSRATIDRMEVRDGRSSRLGTGLIVGLLGGAAVGLVSYQIAQDSYSEDYWRMIHLGLGAGAGMVIGGIVGALSHRDRWRDVPPRAWVLSARPGPSGAFALGALGRF